MTRVSTIDQTLIEIDDRVWLAIIEQLAGRITVIPGAPQAPIHFSGTTEELHALIDAVGDAPAPPPDCGCNQPTDGEVLTLLRRINQRTIETQQKVDAIDAFLKARFR